MKGFALVFTILFLLLLTVFSLMILSMAGDYYASTTYLFENQNARISCEQAGRALIDRHNLADRVFFDSSQWPNRSLLPFPYNGFQISASLKTAWKHDTPNLVTIAANKGRYHAEEELEIAQSRLEGFALYTDSTALIPGGSLIDGKVFARDSVGITDPLVTFRDVVQGSVEPSQYASFRKQGSPELSYPSLSSLLQMDSFSKEADKNGVKVPVKNPLFWDVDHYELDLNQLQIKQKGKKWELIYRNVSAGTCAHPLLFFDSNVRITQNDQTLPFISTKQVEPLYVASNGDISISTNLYPLQATNYEHPLCLIAAKAIRLASDAGRIQTIHACLIALGSELINEESCGLVIDPGAAASTPAQKESIIGELRQSTFIREEDVLSETISAIEREDRVIWIRGGLVLSSAIALPPDVSQLHLQGSAAMYSLLPGLPFVYRLEGTQQWR